MSQRGLERQFLDGFGVGCDAVGPLKAQAAGTRNVRRFARDSSTLAGHTNVAMPIVRACRCAVLCFQAARPYVLWVRQEYISKFGPGQPVSQAGQPAGRLLPQRSTAHLETTWQGVASLSSASPVRPHGILARVKRVKHSFKIKRNTGFLYMCFI